MPHQVTLKPSDHVFSVEDGESVLTAALRAGYTLSYGCRNGACGTCKGKILEGRVDYGTHQESALPPAEKEKGYALFCQAQALTDLVLEARVLGGAGDIQKRTLPCRVQKLELLAPDVMRLELKLPANERLQFLAGQYLEFLLRDGSRRSFSMANAPHDDAFIELHIRNYGGAFSQHVFGKLKARDILRFQAPLGTFFLREDSTKPMVLLASGTGFAPIKALIEHAFHAGHTRPMTLYWGGRRRADLYLNDLVEGWARERPDFRYVPVLSEAAPEDAWTGRTGFVHRAVMEDLPDLSGHQVYACGAPIVVDSARQDYTTRCGLPAEAFFADAFTPAAVSV